MVQSIATPPSLAQPVGEGRPIGPPRRTYGVAVKGNELRQFRLLRGLTGAELARRARVSPATVSQAEHGRRIHPQKMQSIIGVLSSVEPIEGLATLVEPPSEDLHVSTAPIHG